MQKRKLGAVGWLLILILAALFVSAVALFAWQTWEFVNFLLPQENWLMKYLAVANFDVMSLFWLMGELILRPWLEHNTKVTMAIAGGIDFALSTLATVIQLTVVASLRFASSINPILIYVAYGVIAFALVVNIISFIIVIRIQWKYIVGDEQVTPSPQRGGNQQASFAQIAHVTPPVTVTPEQPAFSQSEEVARLQRLKEAAEQRGYSIEKLERMLGVDTSPKATAPLDTTQASQPGQANGHKE